MISGAADGPDAEPLGRDRVELAVAVARDQDLGAITRLVPDEGSQEMLAVPERENRRHLRLDDVVDVGGLIGEAIGQPHQPEVLGCEKPDSVLQPAAAQRITKQMFQVTGFACYFAS